MTPDADIKRLLGNKVSFLAAPERTGDDVVISSRVRLARNLSGFKFPIAAAPEELDELCRIVSDAADHSGALGCPDCFKFIPSELSVLERKLLFERRLTSPEFLRRIHGTELLVNDNEQCSLMINEEDHLRLQTILPGFKLETAYTMCSRLDDELGSQLDYVFDEKIGFLTCCPTNVGTGMRASVMLHLPALAMTKEIVATVQGIGKLNLAVRGIDGEGSDHLGHLYQISNQSTLGESELQIIERISNVIGQLVRHEQNLRENMLSKEPNLLLDRIGRAYGILRHGYQLSRPEALHLISLLRLGVSLEMFSHITPAMVNELFIGIHDAHLQLYFDHAAEGDELTQLRATFCRDKLSECENSAKA